MSGQPERFAELIDKQPAEAEVLLSRAYDVLIAIVGRWATYRDCTELLSAMDVAKAKAEQP
jgi:hypothetical protein